MAEPSIFDAEKIRQQGWRQGSLIKASTANLTSAAWADPGIVPADMDQGLLFLVSQDCDIANPKLPNEPIVEFLYLSPLPAPKNLCKFGRNPRCIHFSITINGIEQWFEAIPFKRIFLPREHLQKLTPESALFLSPKDLRTVTNWVAKRYIRPAFPSSFENRIRTVEKRLRKVLDRSHELLRELLIALNPRQEELTEDTPYTVDLAAVMTHQGYRNDDEREQAQSGLDNIESILSEASGIEVGECRLVSERQVTLEDLDYFTPWDFDFLSVRDEDPSGDS